MRVTRDETVMDDPQDGLGLVLEVLPAIELDDQHAFHASEVGEVRADRMLTPKLVAVETAVPQLRPEQALGVCGN